MENSAPVTDFPNILTDTVKTAIDNDQYNQYSAIEVRDQIDGCVKAALALIEYGVVGKASVKVTIGGHANPNHEPKEGWSNDTVTISVFQTS